MLRVKRGFGRFVLSAAIGASLLMGPLAVRDAHAEPVSATGKGIVGGALLGGELVLSIEALAGVENGWAYLAGGVLGAAGGGVGGYFAEQGSEPRIPLYLLAAGMAFAIPVTIVTLNATVYKPTFEYQEDKGVQGSDLAADAPQPSQPPAASPAGQPSAPAPQGGPAPTPNNKPQNGPPQSSAPSTQQPQARVTHLRRSVSAQARHALPGSMFQVADGSLKLGVPAVEVRPVFSQTELRQYGMAQREEVRVPVFQAVF